jgi:hypothetical protein
LVFVGASALATLHCSSGDDEAFDLGCAAACDKVVAVGCKSDTKETCVADCEANRSAAAECQPQFDALYSCAVGHLVCDMDGKATLDESGVFEACTSSFVAAEVCASCQVKPTDSACAQCQVKTCCGASKAALEHPDTNAYVKCLGACPDGSDTCPQECGFLYPEAAAAIDAAGECVLMSCEDECTAVPNPSGGSGGAGSAGAGGGGGAGGG